MRIRIDVQVHRPPLHLTASGVAQRFDDGGAGMPPIAQHVGVRAGSAWLCTHSRELRRDVVVLLPRHLKSATMIESQAERSTRLRGVFVTATSRVTIPSHDGRRIVRWRR